MTSEGRTREESVDPWFETPRVDIRDKVTGHTKYVEDLPNFPGTAYVAALRSPHPHARILSIDSVKALKLPGVLGVFDREHLDGLNPDVEAGEQSLIGIDKARFQGELLGMVAAVDLRTARRAVELIDVEYEILQPVFSAAQALAPGAPLVHEELGSNLALQVKFEWGDVEQGFQQADRIFEETFSSPNVFHHPMEPTSSFVAYLANDIAELWAPTNTPVPGACAISELFGIQSENVRVRVPYVGGGFGAKPITPEMIAALALSRRIGRPIKGIALYEESFLTRSRHAMVYRAKVGVKLDGTLVALDVDLEVDTGAYVTGSQTATRNACNSAWGCYRIPHFRVQSRTACTNKVSSSQFRATGKTQTTFGIECTIDSVARKIGIDPFELRKKNVLLRGELVTAKWRWGRDEMKSDSPPIDIDFPELMRLAAEAIHWDGRSEPYGSKATAGSRMVRGRGLALSLRRGSHMSGRAYAMATLDHKGILKITHNATDLGQGVNTMICVVASRTLGIPQSQVRVGTPDTVNDLPFDGVNSQRTTVQMGNAVRVACEHLKRELVEAAAHTKGGNPDQWRVAEGRLWHGEMSFAFADIARAHQGHAGVSIKAIGSYGYAPSIAKAIGGLEYWAPGAAAAEVEVDRETGELRVLQYSLVGDAGKALHYHSAKSQIEGGAIMGFGIALFEELRYQDGQLQNADAFQYRLPVMGDIPESFRSVIVENGDGPGPFGSKGIAQISIPCAAPAIANAVYDATGALLQSTPFTPEKILRALGKLDSGK